MSMSPRNVTIFSIFGGLNSYSNGMCTQITIVNSKRREKLGKQMEKEMISQMTQWAKNQFQLSIIAQER